MLMIQTKAGKIYREDDPVHVHVYKIFIRGTLEYTAIEFDGAKRTLADLTA